MHGQFGQTAHDKEIGGREARKSACASQVGGARRFATDSPQESPSPAAPPRALGHNCSELRSHVMSNDAKLGLVVGIGLVILIAIVFFRKDAVPAALAPTSAPVQNAKATTPTAGDPPPAAPQAPPPVEPRPMSPIEPPH
jgi:hypothetical protein